jgi:hypothetical protein
VTVQGAPPPATNPSGYSPHLRTALVLTGVGTSGAYHAGILRAFHEAGVKIDIVAGRGIGAIGAVFAAVDGARHLWEADGLWRATPAPGFYPWRRSLRVAGWLLLAALGLVLVPLLLFAAGLIVYPIALLLRIAHLEWGGRLVDGFASAVATQFEPPNLPTILPRLVALVLAILLAELVGTTLWRNRKRAARRRRRGALWWRAISAPLSATEIHDSLLAALWRVLTGGTKLKQPAPDELSRRYVDLLAENLGQPGFRDLVLSVHDLDVRRDLVFGMLTGPHAPPFFQRRPGLADGGERRAAETIDLTGAGRSHLIDGLLAATALPVLNEPHLMTFAPEHYWRGETHRLCDRVEGVGRLLEEVRAAGADQVVLVGAWPELTTPHSLLSSRADLRGRIGEQLAAVDAAARRDAIAQQRSGFSGGIFQIVPAHNPLGPFDFAGAYDERSDRHQPLSELVDRGYEDAYRQFIEPVVAESGEELGMKGASS